MISIHVCNEVILHIIWFHNKKFLLLKNSRVFQWIFRFKRKRSSETIYIKLLLEYSMKELIYQNSVQVCNG